MAGLVPGVVTGRLDVGGTEGMQQYNLEVFGSADSQKSFSHRRPQDQLGRRQRRRDDAVLRLRDVRGIQHADGVGHRGERCQRRLHEHGDPVGRQPLRERSQPLLHERRAAGRQRRRRAAAAAGTAARTDDGRGGQSRSTSRTTGARRSAGRSSATSVWFFGALRRWRLDQFQIGALNPDGSQAIDDNRIENYMGKATWQIDVDDARRRSCSTAT